MEQQQQLYIQTLNTSEVTEGNDAILKCSFNRQNSLYEISSWMRDDGKIYLPLESLYRNVRQTLGLSGAAAAAARDASAHSTFRKCAPLGSFSLFFLFFV